MSSSVPRCEPRFPAGAALLDNCALVRFWKCGALSALAETVEIHVAGQVGREFRKQGPTERAELERLHVVVDLVRVGSVEWDIFARLRGGIASTRDLGEDESLAIAIAQAQRKQHMPFVTYDVGAGETARDSGVVALDFLDTLAWLVACRRITAERADEIEVRARRVDGWKPPPDYLGSVAAELDRRTTRVVAEFSAWRQADT